MRNTFLKYISTKQKANLNRRRPNKGCANQHLKTFTIRKMGLVYTVCQSLILLTNGCREVILAVGVRFCESCCCGEVAVVERLKKRIYGLSTDNKPSDRCREVADSGGSPVCHAYNYMQNPN